MKERWTAVFAMHSRPRNSIVFLLHGLCQMYRLPRKKPLCVFCCVITSTDCAVHYGNSVPPQCTASSLECVCVDGTNTFSTSYNTNAINPCKVRKLQSWKSTVFNTGYSVWSMESRLLQGILWLNMYQSPHHTTPVSCYRRMHWTLSTHSIEHALPGSQTS